METQRLANICCFCFSPSMKFYQPENCIEPPMHARFDGASELRNALKTILNNGVSEESKSVCVRCNEQIQQIYTFMDCCSKNVLSQVGTTVAHAKKLKTIAGSSSIGQDNQLTTFPRKKDHSDSTVFQVSKLKKMKKAVVRLKRLKMVTFAVEVPPECDTNFYCATGYSRVENNSNRNACETNLKDSEIDEYPEIEDIKLEILEDIHPEDYQVIETSSSALKKHLDKREQRIHMAADKTAAVPELVARDSYNSGMKICFKCDQCESYFSSIYRLKDHQRLHTGESVVWDQSGEKFGTKSLLHAHKSKEHSRSKERYTCQQCKKDFSSASNVRAHRKLHAGIVFDCDNCDAKFPTSSYLQNHKRNMHSGLGIRYKCGQCNKDFSAISHLNVHRQIHSETKFDCDDCDEKFGTRYYLQKHKRFKHSDLKEQYKCEQCDKKFVCYSSLKIHRRRHTGEAFSWSLCDMHFTEPEALQKHLGECKGKMHTLPSLRTVFDCNNCAKTFINDDFLQKHLRICKESSQVLR